jgi:hypothetical protein
MYLKNIKFNSKVHINITSSSIGVSNLETKYPARTGTLFTNGESMSEINKTDARTIVKTIFPLEILISCLFSRAFDIFK